MEGYTYEEILDYMRKDEEWDLPAEEKERAVKTLTGMLLHA